MTTFSAPGDPNDIAYFISIEKNLKVDVHNTSQLPISKRKCLLNDIFKNCRGARPQALSLD